MFYLGIYFVRSYLAYNTVSAKYRHGIVEIGRPVPFCLPGKQFVVRNPDSPSLSSPCHCLHFNQGHTSWNKPNFADYPHHSSQARKIGAAPKAAGAPIKLSRIDCLPHRVVPTEKLEAKKFPAYKEMRVDALKGG